MMGGEPGPGGFHQRARGSGPAGAGAGAGASGPSVGRLGLTATATGTSLVNRAPRGIAPPQTHPGDGHLTRGLPAAVLLAVLLLAGGWRFGSIMQHSFSAYPVASSLAVALFALYAVGFVALLRVIDYLAPEPVVPRLIAFAWGGLVATTAAISGGTAASDILAKTVSPSFAARWGPAVAAAGLEEILKVLGVIALALLGRALLTSVMAGFVYGALVGLGFQVVENVIFAVNAVALQGDDRVEPVVVTFLLRGFLGGLWSHTLFTAMAGAGVAYALVRRDRTRLARITVAGALLLAAWGFHFLWNSPLLADGFGIGPLGAVAVVLVKGIPALLVGAILIVATERREADYYSAILAGLADPRIASVDEIAALVSPRRRFAARRRARLRLGWAGGRGVRRLQRAQAELAVALARDPARQPGSEVHRRWGEVLTRRHQLAALSLAGAGYTTRRTAALAASAVVLAQTVAVAAIVAGIGFALRLLGGS